MKTFHKVNDYKIWVEHDNFITDFNCECPDFIYRKLPLREEGRLEPCKHITVIMEEINKEISINKKTMIGKDKLTSKQKEILREMVFYTCENCGKSEIDTGKLEPHRLVRGNKGGKYIPRNIKMLCNKCHKTIHGMERMGRK